MTRIDEIRERLDKATPGSWEVDTDGSGGSGVFSDDEHMNPVCLYAKSEDIDLIANAPIDLTWCLGEIERLRDELKATMEQCNGSEQRLNEAEAHARADAAYIQTCESTISGLQDALGNRDKLFDGFMRGLMQLSTKSAPEEFVKHLQEDHAKYMPTPKKEN